MKNGVAGVAESETTAPQPNIQFEKMANLTWGVYIFSKLELLIDS